MHFKKALLFIFIALTVVAGSCQRSVPAVSDTVLYEDIIWDMKVTVDLSSMTYSLGKTFTDRLTFCDLASEFRCVMRNDIVWVSVPRDISFDVSESWEFNGLKFTSTAIGNMFKCGNQVNQKWIKIKQVIDRDVYIYIINNAAQIKSFGTEIPQNDFKEKAVGNVSEGDVLGYESLFIALDGCGISVP